MNTIFPGDPNIKHIISVKNGPLSKLPGYPLKVMHDHTDKIETKIFNEDSFLFLGTLIKI